jgi:hypothetical protein
MHQSKEDAKQEKRPVFFGVKSRRFDKIFYDLQPNFVRNSIWGLRSSDNMSFLPFSTKIFDKYAGNLGVHVDLTNIQMRTWGCRRDVR